MEQYGEEYKQRMQLLVDRHLAHLDNQNDLLTPIQKQNRAMKFTLEFDDHSYKTMNSLMARIPENNRKVLKDLLDDIADIMRKDAKEKILY